MRRRPAKEIETGAEADADELRVHDAKDAAAGVTGVAVALKRSVERMGPVRSRPDAAPAQPGRGLRLHELRLAGPRRRAPAHRRVLRERGQGGGRGGHHRAGPTPDFFAGHSIADLDAQSEHWLGQQGRITHPMIKRPGGTHYEPVGWDEAYALIAGTLNALGSARTRRSSTPPAAPPTRRRSPTSCSSARTGPTTCRTAPTCATSRPAWRWPRPSASARPASRSTTCTTPELLVDRRAEPGHQPPADAVRPRDRQAPRGQDPRHQPAARGRPGQLPQPAEAAGPGRAGHRPGRPAPADQDQRRPGPVPGVRGPAARVGRGRRDFVAHLHPRLRGLARPPRPARLGPGGGGHRARPGRRSPRRPGCCATPTAPSSAGRWG